VVRIPSENAHDTRRVSRCALRRRCFRLSLQLIGAEIARDAVKNIYGTLGEQEILEKRAAVLTIGCQNIFACNAIKRQ
jgi:hypothetical protein